MKFYVSILTLIIAVTNLNAQITNLKFGKYEFESKNVKASLVNFNGEQVLKIERDLEKLPFDIKNLEKTVDEPTYLKLIDIDFSNGTIEVKMYSQIQNPSPFEFAQGFIGLAYRIDGNDSTYESIYLRPKVGRSENQKFRNHTVQYYNYPKFKFETLRKLDPEMYESSAPVNINEWITIRVEIEGERAELFVNDAKYSSFVVNKMKGTTKHGSIGLWVDIATIGYFKDLKVIKKS